MGRLLVCNFHEGAGKCLHLYRLYYQLFFIYDFVFAIFRYSVDGASGPSLLIFSQALHAEECLAWAVAYEHQNPGWESDPRPLAIDSD